MNKTNTSKLAQLILGAMSDCDFDRHMLVEKMGYKNINKGLRRLEIAFSDGKYREDFLIKCSAALDLDHERVSKAAQIDNEERQAKKVLLQKESFRPHVYVKTNQTRPSSITLFALTGGVRRHKSFLVPEKILELERDAQFKEVGVMIREHFQKSKGIAPFFGEICGYLYCPDFDESFEFSIVGRAVSDNLGTFQLPVATVRVT